MTKIDPAKVEAIIREVAAAEVMPRFRKLKQHDIAFKTGDDPVTVADKASELALERRLTALLPGSTVVGEESVAADHAVLDRLLGDAPVWILDPIDGTRNFVAGKPVFGLIVALAIKNQTVAGWLYDPNTDEFVTAEQGAGAWHKGQRLGIAPSVALSGMSGTFGPRIMKAFKQANIALTVERPHFIMPMMCACHEYPRLVMQSPYFAHHFPQAHCRATLRACTPWDDAAGVLIHQEAGGYGRHWGGEAYTPSSYDKGLLLAPDADSWHRLRQWVAGFCELPGMSG